MSENTPKQNRQHVNQFIVKIYKTVTGIWLGPVALIGSNLFRWLQPSLTLKRFFNILPAVRYWTPENSSPGWKFSEPNENFCEQNLTNSSAFSWFEAHSSPQSHTKLGMLQTRETSPAFLMVAQHSLSLLPLLPPSFATILISAPRFAFGTQ